MLQPALAELERRGAGSTAAIARSWLGLAEVRLGNLDDAGTDTPLPEGYEAGTRAHLVRAEVHLATGDAGSAVEHAREAVAIAATGDWVVLQADARLTLARGLKLAGDSVAAAEEARSAAALYTIKGYVAAIAEAEAFLSGGSGKLRDEERGIDGAHA